MEANASLSGLASRNTEQGYPHYVSDLTRLAGEEERKSVGGSDWAALGGRTGVFAMLPKPKHCNSVGEWHSARTYPNR